MRFPASPVVVALDASGVSGARLSSGLSGLRCRAFARQPLSSGALVPHGVEGNVVRRQEVKEALAATVAALGGGRRIACLVLPAGTARALLLDVPDGTDPREYARFRLSSTLPYPGSEAVVDVLEAGGSRWLAAAVRRSVVEGYEAVMAGAGLQHDRLDFAPFAALQALGRVSAAEATIDVFLGDAALTIASRRRGRCEAFRSRQRDGSPSEGRWLAEEVARTARLAGLPDSEVRVAGGGAAAVAAALSASGRRAVAPGAAWVEGLPLEAEGAPWLGTLA